MFSILYQEIAWEERLQNDIFCVGWDVKPSQSPKSKGTSQWAVMLCGWEGNRRSDIILATDFSDLTSYELMAYERQMSTPPVLHWEYGNLYLLYGTVERRVWDDREGRPRSFRMALFNRTHIASY